ncbi:hypothetical protein K456DRAFT_1751103 [Colletotrichum gloeosporioides 23]|nr:hypothetical protein K456DRAFT_1751103 [Colletotrichum gloeosporioides 23]
MNCGQVLVGDRGAGIESFTAMSQFDNENFQTRQNPYEALSYTWGDSSNTEIITVNSVELNVTRNLRLALQTLRHQPRNPSKAVQIWVDSICINQDNVAERNAQVSQMGKIYSRAVHVAIWLGDASETSDAAMKLLNDCYKLDSEVEIIDRIVSDEPGGRAIVLSQSATVYCGQRSAEWDVFKRLDIISGRPSLWPGMEIRKGWVLDLRRAFFSIAQFCIGREEAVDMTNVLQPTRNLESSDPRDKLYALLGVCDADSLPPPDYSKPAREVYIDYTKTLIHQDNDLSMLLTAGPWNPENGEDMDLPSWTPDYRGMKGMDIRYFAASHLGYFNAAKGEPPSQETSMHHFNSGSIPVDGIILNVVKTTYFFETMIFDNITLHGGNISDGSIRKENLRRLAVGFIQELQVFYQENRVYEKNEAKTQIKFEIPSSELFNAAAEEYNRLSTKDPEDLHWRREEYIMRTEEVTQGSLTSIFATTSNYIGRGLKTIRNGDIVAVIFGCKLPVVLRQCWGPSTFQFISPCYVSGIMNGESMNDLDYECFSDATKSNTLQVRRLHLV